MKGKGGVEVTGLTSVDRRECWVGFIGVGPGKGVG